MGGDLSAPTAPRFNRDHWQQEGPLKNSLLLKRKIGGALAEQVLLETRCPEFQLHHFARRRQLQRAVKVLDVEVNRSCLGCGESATLRVITEYIPWRLSSFSQLELQAGTTLLEELLQGYQQLFKHFERRFLVSNEMIGFTPYETRVWLNSNFAVNQPELCSGCDPGKEQEASVRSLVSVVEKQLGAGKFPPGLINRIDAQGWKYAGAIEAVSDFIDQLRNKAVAPSGS